MWAIAIMERITGSLPSWKKRGVPYVMRLREQAAIEIVEEIAVSPTDRQSGVLRQAWVVLGCKARYRSTRVRLVWVETSKEVLLLVTNQEPPPWLPNWWPLFIASVGASNCSSAGLNAFWVVGIGWPSPPAASPLKFYLALIAALLLQLYSGRRPNRRMLELIQLYLLGVASSQDLQAGWQRELLRLQKSKPPQP